MKHPCHPVRQRARWALAAGVLAGVTLLLLVRARREADLTSPVREEWTALLSCLTGGSSTGDVRGVELGYVTHADGIEAEVQRRLWIDRCETAATRLLSLLSRESLTSDPKQAPLRELVDEVRDSLRSDRLPPPDTITAMLREAEGLGVRTNQPSTLAYERAGPLLSLEQLPKESLANGRFALAASDPVPSRDVHLVLEQEAGARACIFPATSPALSTYRCADIAGAPEAEARWRWESPNELQGDFLTRTKGGESEVYRFDTELLRMGSVPGEMLGVVGTGTDATLLVANGQSLAMYSVQPRSLELLKRSSMVGLSWILAFGNEVLWAAPRAGSHDQDHVLSATLESIASIPAGGVDRGSVFENAAPLACESGKTRAVLLLRNAGRTAFSWEREAVVFLRDTRGWSPALATSASWTTVPSAGVAYPRTPTFTCRSGEAVLTWAEGDDENVIRQLRCTREGCVTRTSRLRGSYRNILLADLDGKVLLVRTDTEHHILRMRLAPIDELAKTRDVVLFDEGGTVNDASPSMALHAFVRESAALVLLRIARENRADVFAVRVDPAGRVTLTQPSAR